MENVSTESNDTDSETVSLPEHLTDEAYINLRIGKPKSPEPKEEEEESQDESAADANDEQEVEEDPSKNPKADETVLSNINLEDMSEAELKEYVKKTNSRAVARYSELTARTKAAEEKLAALEAKGQQEAPPPTPKVKDNPYKAVKDLQTLQAKFNEVDETIEYAQDLLWQSDHLAHDDEITEINGKVWTKQEVRTLLREAEKARKTYLPAQANVIKEGDQRKAQKQGLSKAVREELSWLEGEDSDVKRQFQGILNGPILKKVIEAVPEFEPYAEYLTAHAANSIWNKPKASSKAPSSTKLTPPNSPSSAANKTEAPAGIERQMKELRKKLDETGDEDAYERLRTLQLSRKK
jgi:hypothetical protein